MPRRLGCLCLDFQALRHQGYTSRAPPNIPPSSLSLRFDSPSTTLSPLPSFLFFLRSGLTIITDCLIYAHAPPFPPSSPLPSIMADKESGQAFAPVLAAVATMQGNVPRSEKTQAHEFLEKFQKSVCPISKSIIQPSYLPPSMLTLTRRRSRPGKQPTLYYSRSMFPSKLSCSPQRH